MSFRATLSILLLSVMTPLLSVSATRSQSAEQPEAQTVDTLVHLLGSKDFKDRERATKQLVQRKGARLALERAHKSADLEVARRIELILKERARQQAKRGMERLKLFAQRGALDQVAELLATWPAGYEEAACWEELRKLAARLVDLNHKGGGKTLPRLLRPAGLDPGPPFEHEVIVGERVTKLPHKRKATAFFIRAKEVCVEGAGASLSVSLTCARAAQLTMLPGSIIFAAGPVTLRGHAGHTIVVADGDVTVEGWADHCLIITRGSVICAGLLGDSQLLTQKRLIFKEGGRLFKCNVSTFAGVGELGFVTFFQIEDHGLFVEPVQRGVLVKGCRPETSFAKGGLARGDKVIEVDGEAVNSCEDLRRLLRRSWTLDDGATVRILRQGKTQELWLEAPAYGK